MVKYTGTNAPSVDVSRYGTSGTEIGSFQVFAHHAEQRWKGEKMKEPLVIKINNFATKKELEDLRLSLQLMAGDKPVVLLPHYADLVGGNAWTPCKVKNPEYDGWYLVTTHKGTVKMSYFRHGPNRNYWTMGATNPIAWAELPKGYKE